MFTTFVPHPNIPEETMWSVLIGRCLITVAVL